MQITSLTRPQCWDFLGETRLGRLACAREGQPYVVPLNFAAVSPYLYALTTLGRKVEYLRGNPRVCVQFDDIASPQAWTSVLVEGRYEELTDAAGQDHAFHLLQRRAMWWEPAYVRTVVEGGLRPATPLYFRILVEEISGRCGGQPAF